MCAQAQAAAREGPSASELHLWTFTHSFYAVMGGFGFSAKPEDLRLPNGHQRLTISAHGVRYLAKKSPGILPNLPASEICDRGKASALAKIFVCVQG